MQAAETVRLRNFFEWVIDVVLRLEHVNQSQPHALDELQQHQAFEVIENTRFMADLRPQDEPVVVSRHGGHENPGDGDWNEHLPAQAHDLIVSVARKTGAEPQKAEGEEQCLGEHPPQMPDCAKKQARGQPSPGKVIASRP